MTDLLVVVFWTGINTALHLVVGLLGWICKLGNSIFCAPGDSGSRGRNRMCPSIALFGFGYPTQELTLQSCSLDGAATPCFFISSPYVFLALLFSLVLLLSFLSLGASSGFLPGVFGI